MFAEAKWKQWRSWMPAGRSRAMCSILLFGQKAHRGGSLPCGSYGDVGRRGVCGCGARASTDARRSGGNAKRCGPQLIRSCGTCHVLGELTRPHQTLLQGTPYDAIMATVQIDNAEGAQVLHARRWPSMRRALLPKRLMCGGTMRQVVNNQAPTSRKKWCAALNAASMWRGSRGRGVPVVNRGGVPACRARCGWLIVQAVVITNRPERHSRAREMIARVAVGLVCPFGSRCSAVGKAGDCPGVRCRRMAVLATGRKHGSGKPRRPLGAAADDRNCHPWGARYPLNGSGTEKYLAYGLVARIRGTGRGMPTIQATRPAT